MVTPVKYKILRDIADTAKSIEKKYIKDYINNYIDEGEVTYVGRYKSVGLKLNKDAEEVTVVAYNAIDKFKPSCPINMPTTIEEATKMFDEQVRTKKMIVQAHMALRYLTC